jgi:hypothetical protein
MSKNERRTAICLAAVPILILILLLYFAAWDIGRWAAGGFRSDWAAQH